MPRRWLPLLRALWVLVIVLSIGLSIVSWGITYRREFSNCTSSLCAQASIPEGTVEAKVAFQALGLSRQATLVFHFAMEALAMMPYFLVGAILFSRRFQERIGFLGAFVLPAFAAAGVGSTGILISVSSYIGIASRILTLVGQSIFVFFLIFPDGQFVPRWTRWLAWIWVSMYIIAIPLGIDPGDYIGPGFALFYFTMFGTQIYRFIRVSGPAEKQQTKWVVIGVSLSFGAFILLLGFFSLIPASASFNPIMVILTTMLIYLLLAIPAIVIAIAILRNRLWDIEVFVNRALIYGPLSAILAGAFAASISLINQAAREIFGTQATTSAAVVSALIIASIFQPLRTRIEGWVNKHFYPDNLNLAKEFIEFSPQFQSFIRLEDLLRIVTKKIRGLVKVKHAAVYLADKRGVLRRVNAYPALSVSRATFTPAKAVRKELTIGHVVSNGEQQGALVPLYVKRLKANDLIGVLDLGPHVNKTGFSSDDKKALGKLGAELGASIYAAQLRVK